MKENKTIQTLSLSAALMKSWSQSHNFDLEVNRLRRSGTPEAQLKTAINLCLCVFRKKQSLDKIVALLSPKKPRGRVMHLLLPSMAGMLYMEKVTPQGFADSAVSTAKKLLSKHEANFLNSFFHKLVEQREEMLATSANKLNLGDALEASWQKRFTRDEIKDLAQTLSENANLTVRSLNKDFPVNDNLRALELPAWADKWNFYEIINPAQFFQEAPAHSFYIQDPATALSIDLLQAQEGESIADLCAAPGGKTLYISDLVGDKGKVYASDISEKRLEMMRENLSQRSNVDVRCIDARELEASELKLDAILLDVPCSNTGVLRRKPDARWSFSQKKLAELMELQVQILDQAASLLGPGGRLVFSTCSIEPEENNGQVEAFLKRHPDFKLEDSKQLIPNSLHDGAFAARLVKN